MTTFQNKYVYSQLSSESVETCLENYYDIGVINRCVFYVFGLHDNYLIESKKGKYILRIYRNDWRVPDEIFFELELLNYLHSLKQSIAYPLTTNDEKYAFAIESPEGERFAALFTYADGKELTEEISNEESKILGSTVANIHKASNGFKTSHQRKELNLSFLIDESIALIEPFINTKQKKLVTRVQETIQKNLSQLSPDIADYGICTGDVNQRNFHINDSKKITVFDFDQCGYGYRAFELGKYLSSIHHCQLKEDLMRSFVEGYEKVRSLNEVEKQAIPYFEIASVIWVMSIRVANKNKVGYINLKQSYWDQRLGIVKSLYEQLD